VHVRLPAELEKFVEAKLRSGGYASADQVMEDALARWKAQEQIDPAELRSLVAEGQASADRGELVDSEEVFKEIEHKSRQRQKKRA
jgi:putative addiction module CopG family antidote